MATTAGGGTGTGTGHRTWAVWLLVNLVSVGLFAWKSLWLTAVLYALFAALSIVGWRAWRRRL